MGKKPNDHAHFIEKCKEYNLRITPQRTAIYREISKSGNHPSADAVFQAVRKEFPNLSFDTVYRTLLTFSEIGLIDVVEGQGGPRRFDPNMESHHHFYCMDCGKIIDFYSRDYDDLKIPEDIEEKFTVLGKRVVLKGIWVRLFCDDHKKH